MVLFALVPHVANAKLLGKLIKNKITVITPLYRSTLWPLLEYGLHFWSTNVKENVRDIKAVKG